MAGVCSALLAFQVVYFGDIGNEIVFQQFSWRRCFAKLASARRPMLDRVAVIRSRSIAIYIYIYIYI